MSSLATAVTKKSLKIRPEAESSCLKLRANGNEAGLTIFPLDRKPRITRDESRLFAFNRLKRKKFHYILHLSCRVIPISEILFTLQLFNEIGQYLVV